MAAIFLLIVLGYISLAVAAPVEILCYDCPEVKNPGECLQQRRCPHHEYCAADVFEDPPGELKWKFHCRGHHECPAFSIFSVIGRKRAHLHEPNPAGHVLCQECCTTDSCNINLCQNALANVNRVSPICYECHDVKHPSDCNKTRMCAHDEICATEISGVTLAEQRWKFFCKKQHECPVTSHVGRKREPGPHGPGPHPDPNHPDPHHQHLACRQCCQADYCNKMLCQPATAAPSITVSTAPSTTVSTAPSTTVSTTTSTAATTSAPLIFTATHATLPVSPVNIGVTVHASQLTCVDIPLPSVNCGDLAGRGLCTPVPGSIYEMMKLHCRKTCNFC